MNKSWVYVAWIRNHQLPEDDQDCKSPCVIIIEASDEIEAKGWGDKLYKDELSNDKMQSFLWSEVHTQDTPRYKNGISFFSENETDWADTPRCIVGQKLPSEVLY